ncbi:MAG: methyltransferase domain-containing protein [Pseudomonadota bacterium]
MLRLKIIKEKKFLKKLYNEFYSMILKELPADYNAPILEIGSGGGFLKEYIPGLLTSEILMIKDVDTVLDARNIPFKENSLSGIVMLNVFHHIPSINSFLKQASFCIKQKGLLVMIEPWVSPWSEFVYKHLHHEPFDPETKEWSLTKDDSPLSHANSALPWIVFERDKDVFEQKYPNWKIKNLTLHTPFCYILSGGVSMRSFMPGWLFKFFHGLEKSTAFWNKYLAMFALIVLEKRR